MDTAEFYAVVRQQVGPLLKTCGFRRTVTDVGLAQCPRAGRWIKQLPGTRFPAPDRLILSFEHSKWGWLPSSGGEFRVNLEVGACADVQQLLDGPQHSELLDLQRRVLAKIRRQPAASSALVHLMEESASHPGAVRFLPYWDADDVTDYIRMLLPLLPGLAARLGGHPTWRRTSGQPADEVVAGTTTMGGRPPARGRAVDRRSDVLTLRAGAPGPPPRGVRDVLPCRASWTGNQAGRGRPDGSSPEGGHVHHRSTNRPAPARRDNRRAPPAAPPQDGRGPRRPHRRAGQRRRGWRRDPLAQQERPELDERGGSGGTAPRPGPDRARLDGVLAAEPSLAAAVVRPRRAGRAAGDVLDSDGHDARLGAAPAAHRSHAHRSRSRLHRCALPHRRRRRALRLVDPHEERLRRRRTARLGLHPRGHARAGRGAGPARARRAHGRPARPGS